MTDRMYRTSEPDLDRFEQKPFDPQDEPNDGEPYAEAIDPAEHAAHSLIDALCTMEVQLAQVSDLQRAFTLKQIIHRAWERMDRVDLKASEKLDELVERRR